MNAKQKQSQDRKKNNRFDKKKSGNRHFSRFKSKDSQKRHFAPKKWTSKISEHFSKKDFTCKESGEFKLSLGLVGALEELWSKVRKRIEIVKGFESVDVAEKHGRMKKNYHAQGLAADIRVDGMGCKDLFLMAKSIQSFSGIGLNIEENYVHVDTRKAERLCWVEEKNEEIELTEDNKQKYFA